MQSVNIICTFVSYTMLVIIMLNDAYHHLTKLMDAVFSRAACAHLMQDTCRWGS